MKLLVKLGLSLATFAGGLLLAGSAHASVVTHACTVGDVTVYPDRVHVFCTTAGPSSIIFFALSTADTAVVDRFIALGTTALVAKKKLLITYDTVYANHNWSNVSGCNSSGCRIPYSFSLQ